MRLSADLLSAENNSSNEPLPQSLFVYRAFFSGGAATP
jgi:hypothetical protein